MNWKVRLKNKYFWLVAIPTLLLLAHQILKLFGIDFEYTVISEELCEIVETVFVLLALIGVVNDPTTAGLKDSSLAMTYEVPKTDYSYMEGKG